MESRILIQQPSAEPWEAGGQAVGRSAAPGPLRARAHGKFLAVGEEKLPLRGVTYGTFRPGADGHGFPDPERVRQDFRQMAAAGFNTLRTYTAPPAWLLDEALAQELWVLVGLPWQQHVTFLDSRSTVRVIEETVRADARCCAGHPAVLALSVGNEIPAPIARWHGRRRVERFIERLYRIVKAEDPEALVTYVNYPTTEYLWLPFLDFVSFNVFLESQAAFRAYLARLQNLAGDRPLVMTELGLDSRSHGVEEQASSLAWQLDATAESGCAGAFVFAWTDEWHRGGFDVEDWDFGLTTRDRRPKPALAEAGSSLAGLPLRPDAEWPSITVAICAHNAEATLEECLRAVERLEYPNYEVLVVDDGSTDRTPEIAERFPVRLIRKRNGGLSRARNTAWQEARGEIVAYLDSDAYPDPHWLAYLAHAFRTTDHAGVGGPNIVPPDAGFVETCVAHSPGGPIHVLLTDEQAEHIPGCNMAFRRAALAKVGGFRPRYRIAGDDVDICWRIQERGRTLGFHAGAVVWHHRRSTVSAYWRQQVNYGRAEAVLERKWPAKYNALGHPSWQGRLYGTGRIWSLFRRGRVYSGTWGSSLFQSVYSRGVHTLEILPSLPESWLVVALLALLSALGLAWSPLLWFLPVLLVTLGTLAAVALGTAFRAKPPGLMRRALADRVRCKLLIAAFQLIQPMARLLGRLHQSLTPWRRRGSRRLSWPWSGGLEHWSETWREPSRWLADLEAHLINEHVLVRRGGDFDGWDLEAWAGVLGGVRLQTTVEEHGWGRQLLRLRQRPRVVKAAIWIFLPLAALSVAATLDRAWFAGAALGAMALLVAGRTSFEAATASRSVRQVIENWTRER